MIEMYNSERNWYQLSVSLVYYLSPCSDINLDKTRCTTLRMVKIEHTKHLLTSAQKFCYPLRHDTLELFASSRLVKLLPVCHYQSYGKVDVPVLLSHL